MFKPEQSILVVIDVQGNLAQAVHDKKTVYHNMDILLHAARLLEIPCLLTQQVPTKLGGTIPTIFAYFKPEQIITKTSFSCMGSELFVRALENSGRKQILISGIETHVCVYQTTRDLLAAKYDVEVVRDAVSSRTNENKNAALKKIQSLGAGLTTTEMIVCEWLGSADHPRFKDVLKLIK